MKREMAIFEDVEEEHVDTQKGDIVNDKKKKKNKRKNKTLLEKAEDFATIIASAVDGGATVLGSSLPLIPFFFGRSLDITHFIFSYIILICLLVYLGNYLGKISGSGRVRYALHLVAAGVVTLLVTLLLGAVQ